MKTSDRIFFTLSAVAAAALCVSVYAIFFRAPIEATMGIVQKVFYFHMPCIYSMYVGAAVCLVGSAGYLWRGTQRWDSLARAGGEVAVVMGFMMLVTGSLWARKAWGVWWTWDPRLTTALLSVLVYVAYVVLRAFAGGGDGEKKFAAALGVLGAANLPIIHLAVKKWGGTHPSVVYNKGGGLKHPEMINALLLGLLAFSFLTAVLVWLRLRQDAIRARVDEAEEEATMLGLLEE
ncbi:MAG: cytochrome c biogenesis protein CcsA [Myxococcales bacterium]|nr:cytochrome c biogenesis protein CcsA [Myxococcales bacterium]